MGPVSGPSMGSAQIGREGFCPIRSGLLCMFARCAQDVAGRSHWFPSVAFELCQLFTHGSFGNPAGDFGLMRPRSTAGEYGLTRPRRTRRGFWPDVASKIPPGILA